MKNLHDQLFGSAAELLIEAFGEKGSITVCPRGGGNFSIDGAIGAVTFLSEEDTGGDFVVQQRRVRVATVDLIEHDIDGLPTDVLSEVDGESYSVDPGMSNHGKTFTLMQLSRAVRRRRKQMR